MPASFSIPPQRKSFHPSREHAARPDSAPPPARASRQQRCLLCFGFAAARLTASAAIAASTKAAAIETAAVPSGVHASVVPTAIEMMSAGIMTSRILRKIETGTEIRHSGIL